MVAPLLPRKSIILLFITCAVFVISLGARVAVDSTKSGSQGRNGPDPEDIKMGERLFYGLVKTGDQTVNCASCHNTGYIDTLNWNPSAFEIASLYYDKDTDDLAAALRDPVGTKLSAAHAGINLDDRQIAQIKVFLNYFQARGTPNRKPMAGNVVLFIISVLVALALTTDLIFTKKIRPQWIAVIILLLVAGYQVKIMAHEAVAIGRSKNYSPLQPIKFSHMVHVTGNRIDCRYCHSFAEYSKTAGIPSANVCLNCHMVVREGPHSGKFEINKIHYAVDHNQPINWIKVHNLPDYVFFSHEQHVTVGKVQCAECHGDVAHMDVIRQVKDLSMGWCINCHREKQVQFYSNEFYKKYEALHKAIKEGKIDKVTVEKIGGTECMKCHY